MLKMRIIFLCFVLIQGILADTGVIFDAPDVFLTLNAKAEVDENGALQNRMIEVNWANIEVNPGNWIGLFNENPTFGRSTPVFKITPTSSSGSIKTIFRFDVLDYRQVEISPEECMGYYAAYFVLGSEKPVVVNCLKVYPKWMTNMREIIGEKTLAEIMIPGTHNSGAWKIYEGRPDDINLILKYSRNQEDDIYTQLFHGIRYLDLRVGYYPLTNEKFWVNHAELRIRPLQTVIDDVNAFCAKYNEIVIVDIHQLEVGFSGPEQERKLADFLEQKLGDVSYLRGSGSNPSLNRMWEMGKTVYLTFPSWIYGEYDCLWPILDQAWGDVNKVDKLEAYFSEELPLISCRGDLHAAMAELTPTALDVILKPTFGLRGFAQLVNLDVTQWFRRQKWYSMANIVATDFYLGNDIIRVALEVNRNSGTCS